jgi:type I restriction enzyme S subunit
MGSRLPPYPAYRDSGLGWLPQLPAHWEVRRNGRLFAQRVETGREELPILEVSLRTGVRVRSFGEGGRKQVMADRAKYKRAAAGDIAYNMMRLWQGAVGVVPEDGLVSPAYVVAAPYEDVEPRYFAYLFRTADYMREVEGFSRGIVADRNRLYWAQFKQMPSPYPPLEEQRRIADYLDAHGRLTARLIRNRRRLVATLRQYKGAAIEAKLTTGLDPSTSCSPTSALWPTSIPHGWDVVRLKQVATINPSRSEAPTGRGDLEVTFLPMERVSVTGRVDSSQRISSAAASGLTYFRRDDVVVAKITPCFENGKGAVLHDLPTDYGFGTTEFFVLRASSRITPDFLYRLTACPTFRAMGTAAMTGAAGQQRVPLDFVREFSIPLPPVSEQALITQWINSFEEAVERAERGAARAIEVLQEHRERLIAEAVAGCVDVRAADIALPDAGDDAGSSELEDDESDGAEAEAEDDLEAALAEAEE